MLNNRRLTSGSYTVLVSIGDLVRLVFALEPFLKSSKKNPIGIHTGLGAAIQATYLLGSKSSLYTIFYIWCLRLAKYRRRLVVYFMELRYRKVAKKVDY